MTSICNNCNASIFIDYEIHGGDSVRRDCAHCGRTLCFTKWLGVDQFSPPETMANEAQRRQVEIRHAEAARFEASQTQRRKRAAAARLARRDEVLPD